MLKQLRYFALILCVTVAGNVFAQNYQWGNVPIGGGGFVSAVIPSTTVENLVYARTDVGGAYRWDNANSQWIPLTDWVSEAQTGYLGVESLALDPNNDAYVYMLVGISYFNNGKTAILKSTDYGETFSIVNVSNQFKAHGNGMGRQNGEKLVVDPNNSDILYCGTRWNGLFKSTNAGATWSRVSALNVTTTPNENGISLVVLDKSKVSGGNTQTMFVGVSRTGSNFYKTTNGGQTFTEVTGGPTNLMPQRASLASDGNLYITYADGAGPHGHWAVPEPMENGQVWKYNTTSGGWTNVTPAGFTRAFGGVNVDPTNPNRVVLSTINTYLLQDNAYGDRVFLSTNGGSSWTDVMNNGVDIQPNGVTWIDGHAIHWAGSVEFDPFDSQKVWITSGNGVFVNDNIAASPSIWRFEVDGLEETVPLDIESIKNGPLVSVIGDYDGFTHKDVTDYAPIHTPRMGTTTGLDIAELNTDIRLRVGNEMYYTLNGGSTWSQATINGEKGRVAVSADGKTFLHSPEVSSTTYYSTNNGSSWSTSSGISISEAKPTADPVNATKFYAYNPSNGTMYVSTNSGQSFSAAGNAGTNGSKIIRLNPNVEGDIWIAMNYGGLKHSTNSGQSFTTISGVTQCGAVGLGKAAPDADYPTVFIWGTVNGVQGVHRSIDKGVSWTRINDDAHQYGGPGNGQFVIGDWNEFGRVYMSTAGRGIVTGSAGTKDCNQVENGIASIDDCGICSGGTTGIDPNSTCEQDCNNQWGGTASVDDCGICAGGTTGKKPCSTVLEDGRYVIHSVKSGLCLSPGSPVTQQTCNSSTSQQWDIKFVNEGYQITNVNSTNKLVYAGTTAGDNINTTISPINSKFTLEDAGNDQFLLVNGANSNLVVDVSGGATTPGINLLLWTRTGGENQLFTFESIITSSKSLEENQLAIYPNPATSRVIINGDFNGQWELFNSYGKAILSGNENQVSLESVSSGIYMLLINNQTYKIVKE